MPSASLPHPTSSESQSDRKGCAKGNCSLLSPLGLFCCSSFFWTLWLFKRVPFSIESFHCISYLHRHYLYVGCLGSVNQIGLCGAPHNLQACGAPGSASEPHSLAILGCLTGRRKGPDPGRASFQLLSPFGKSFLGEI